MSSRHKGLQRVGSGLGKIGRIFVPASAAVKHAREREEEELKRRRRIVTRREVGQLPRASVRDSGRNARKNKLAAKRHAARKIATASRRRNRGA